ncbi:MAG: TonB-dependent receptor [Pseudomonadota bacterium]
MSRLLPIACLALLGSAPSLACAQQQDSSTSSTDSVPARPNTPIPQVTVNGSRADDTELRRMSTASKLIFGREELDRNGDTSIGEILKRLPGVTMGGRPGRGGAVRMRGLGNGYTQMLVNGERAPAGFSLESLSPDQVERIEVIRGPVAEHSTQAIAGTINIVLREGYQQKDIQLKLSDSIEQERHGPNVSLTVPGKLGGLTWLFNGALFVNRQHDDSATHNLDQFDSGVVQREQQVHDETDRRTRGIHLSPRLAYKFDNGDTLTFQPFLVNSHSASATDSTLSQSIGSVAPEYALQKGATTSNSTFLRGFGNWLHKMDGAARLDVKFGFGSGHSDNATARATFNADASPKKNYLDSDATHDHGFNTGGKYSAPLGAGHLLAAGWDFELGHRSETKTASGDLPEFEDAGANLAADTRRFASFVQDEWDITPQWSVYAGLRWEGIRTTSSGATRADISNRSSVWSPVAHAVYRIPGSPKDQLRASLTQSYRAPPLADLIAAPSFSIDNRPTRPDRIGNPNLKPELARGIDLAYEHYLGKSGIVSASAFGRQIDNLMRREITQASSGRWVSAPTNIGHASTSGVELEAKFQLAEVMAEAPNIDLRSNYSHFWSRVDGIPGPNNRLDQQARQTANLGLDYRMKELPLTLGSSWNWTPATLVQTSLTEVASSGVKRQLDLYGLWKWSAQTQLRVAANNLLGAQFDSARSVTTNGLAQMAASSARTYTTFNLKLEMKL